MTLYVYISKNMFIYYILSSYTRLAIQYKHFVNIIYSFNIETFAYVLFSKLLWNFKLNKRYNKKENNVDKNVGCIKLVRDEIFKKLVEIGYLLFISPFDSFFVVMM